MYCRMVVLLSDSSKVTPFRSLPDFLSGFVRGNLTSRWRSFKMANPEVVLDTWVKLSFKCKTLSLFKRPNASQAPHNHEPKYIFHGSFGVKLRCGWALNMCMSQNRWLKKMIGFYHPSNTDFVQLIWGVTNLKIEPFVWEIKINLCSFLRWWFQRSFGMFTLKLGEWSNLTTMFQQGGKKTPESYRVPCTGTAWKKLTNMFC